jgi:crotonobetainyl-CoA:carnitine CoA-transferase CaiB-like acyl-CoA transferase
MEPWLYANLCKSIGREDFIPFQFTSDLAKREEIFTIFRQVFKTKTRDEWFDYLVRSEVPAGKVYTFDELDSDPHIMAHQMIVELTHNVLGNIKQVGIPVKLSSTPGQVKRLGPKLGEHTREVLLALGYTESAIDNLQKVGAIQVSDT